MDRVQKEHNNATQFSIEELEQGLEMAAPSDGEIVISQDPPITFGPDPNGAGIHWWF
ncbi:MAG: hypothetical protein IJU72_05560 [Bacteroidales bacterium]|nr:hypothetical protein [Bacteroidales bacterium]